MMVIPTFLNARAFVVDCHGQRPQPVGLRPLSGPGLVSVGKIATNGAVDAICSTIAPNPQVIYLSASITTGAPSGFRPETKAMLSPLRLP
jgi:hypothetical protein